MDCQKTTARSLMLRGVVSVSEWGEGRSREQHISTSIEQTVECSAHLEIPARLFETRAAKTGVKGTLAACAFMTLRAKSP